MTAASHDPSDTRTTGEHFLAAPASPDQMMAAHRISDLSSQITFLESEVARYQELVESERIRHAKDISEISLEADRRLDEMRREEKTDTDGLHESYRSLMAQRQIDFDESLSRSAAAHAKELADERRRHEENMERERLRRETELERTSQRIIDELYEAHHQAHQSFVNEAEQAAETQTRLEADLIDLSARVEVAEASATEHVQELLNIRRRLKVSEARRSAQAADFEEKLQVAEFRIDAERQRSSATLAELLERSATLASEADKARADAAASLAKAEFAAASERERLKTDYQALLEATERQAAETLVRESALEAEIARLRSNRLG